MNESDKKKQALLDTYVLYFPNSAHYFYIVSMVIRLFVCVVLGCGVHGGPCLLVIHVLVVVVPRGEE